MTLQDIHGKEITIGCRIVWKERWQEYVGVVEYDARYTDSMKVGGMSVKYIWEHCDWVEVV